MYLVNLFIATPMLVMEKNLDEQISLTVEEMWIKCLETLKGHKKLYTELAIKF